MFTPSNPSLSCRILRRRFSPIAVHIYNGLQPLHQLHGLRYLEIAAFYSDGDFLALRQALPNLTCQWLDLIDRYGSIKAAIKALTHGAAMTAVLCVA